MEITCSKQKLFFSAFGVAAYEHTQREEKAIVQVKENAIYLSWRVFPDRVGVATVF